MIVKNINSFSLGNVTKSYKFGTRKEKSQKTLLTLGIMKIFISVVAISFFSLTFGSCSQHSSCRAYTDSMEKGMKFDKNIQKEVIIESENV